MLKLIKIIIVITVSLLMPFGLIHISAADRISDFAVSAKSYVLIESKTGFVICGKQKDDKMPIASTTKIMTALITLEQPNISDVFEVDANAIMVEGSSMGLQAGDKVTLEALAYGMLLPSGNDAANAAAVKIAGNTESFSKIMNEYAKKIGMVNSNFVTASGLDAALHYSTAYDMALLARQAISNDAFANICKKQKAIIMFGNPMQKRTLTNHNKLLSIYDGCIGIKTGFTKKAGRCLVGTAQKDGITLICVTLNAPNDWQDQQMLFDYGFDCMPKTEITPKVIDIIFNVVGGVSNTINVKALSKTIAPIESSQAQNLVQKVIAEHFFYAPIKKGELVGRIEHSLNGAIVATTDLIAQDDVEINTKIRAKTFLEKIKDFFKTILK